MSPCWEYVNHVIPIATYGHFAWRGFYARLHNEYGRLYPASSKWFNFLKPKHVDFLREVRYFSPHIATITSALTIGIDFYGYRTEKISGTKFGVDMALVGIGFTGPMGAVVSMAYFGLDILVSEVYPDKGWEDTWEDFKFSAKTIWGSYFMPSSDYNKMLDGIKINIRDEILDQ